MSDTICAIATPLAAAALGVVRLSGPGAVSIASKVLVPFSGKLLKDIPARSLINATAYDAQGQPIDSLMAVRFAAPASFTGEDAVEFYCHGSPLILHTMMAALIANGARQALPGEFTKRAFLNGKADLLAAEGVMELISAKSRRAVKVALSHLSGRTGAGIAALRDEMIHILAGMMAALDFPDEDIEEQIDYKTPILEFLRKVEGLRATYSVGKAFCDGVPTVILGCPNVGKSTLMNLLTGDETSIVTEVPGTTRDVVEKHVTIGEFTLVLADTAGLRDTQDVIESIGVERAVKRTEDSRLLLCVFDGSRGLLPDDARVLEAAAGKTAIAILNKADQGNVLDTSLLEKGAFAAVVSLSAKTGEGFELLIDAISSVLGVNNVDVENTEIITNLRHFESLCRAADALHKALEALDWGLGEAVVSLELESAVRSLGEITGQTVSDEIVDRIFERFCLGK